MGYHLLLQTVMCGVSDSIADCGATTVYVSTSGVNATSATVEPLVTSVAKQM